MNTITHYIKNLLSYWKKQSLAQKITIIYLFVILWLLIFIPIISINNITDDSKNIISLWNASTTKIFTLLLFCIIFLIFRNAFSQFRDRIYIIFGFQATQPFVTFIWLSFILFMLLSVSDVIWLTRQYISTNISMYIWFIIYNSILFFWMIRQLVIARLQWKQKIKYQEISLHKQDFHHKEHFQTSNWWDQNQKLL